ncbi:ATP-binding protein [Flavobacterium sp. SUN052]|uniref:ATP-binding protein n=1 Tax=Flavobacterium sp. SUN052 TaxID=3002441 RepID=UPI00237D7952|nr:ATP-binding protein [Flavobacterium sp. SUN052]MEC4004308.1 ATP-binding protein [Flavobacterium sp. SUN052]
MKNLIILLFVSVFFFSCKKENTNDFNTKNNIDILLTKASQSLNPDSKLNIANKASKELENYGLDSISRKQNIELARIYYSLDNKKYVNICKRLLGNQNNQNNDEISFCNFLLGNFYYNQAKYDESYTYYSNAEKAFLKKNNLDYVSFSLAFKANILIYKKDFVGAEVLAIKAIKIAIQKKNNELIYNCYLTLGNSSLGLSNFNKAIEYFNKAISTCQNLETSSNYLAFSIQPLNYISIVYQKQEKYNKSIHYAEKALNFAGIKNKEILIYAYLTNNVAYSKFKLGDKSSIKQFQETLKIGDSIQSIPIQITSKTYLGEYYLAQKDTVKSNFYLKSAQNQAHKNNIFEDELKILQLLAQANPNDKSFYSNRYITLNDSLQNVERATRDKFARIEFETDEITNQNQLVSKENDSLYKGIWIVLGFGILSLMVIMLWYTNKLQNAKNRELLLKQEQQKANEEIYQLILDQQQQIEEGKNIEKQRISLELHDGVMGKLSAVRLNLYAALYKANLIEDELFAKQIDEIQTVEQEIRTIAHDLNSNLFSDNANFIGIVKELFTKIESHSSIQFTLQVSDAVNWDLVNNVVKINLYRIVQEALQNIEKYAQASNVFVVMTKIESNELQIEISDDGKGFDTTLKKDGIGLNNMKKRVAELNGKISIKSTLKKGTKINLIIPY